MRFLPWKTLLKGILLKRSVLIGFSSRLKESLKRQNLTEETRRILGTFSRGSKALLSDLREYVRAQYVLYHVRDWDKAFGYLSSHQLNLCIQLPRELFRVGPVLLVSALPFAQNLVFPLAYMFPKRFLSSHFWTQDTEAEYLKECAISRRRFYHTMFREFQSRLYTNRFRMKTQELSIVMGIEQDLANGREPDLRSLEALKTAFAFPDGIFCFPNLDVIYLRNLCKIHGRQSFWFPRYYLRQYARTLLQLDRLTMRYYPSISYVKKLILPSYRDGSNSLSKIKSTEFCRLRGLDSDDEKEMFKFIERWLRVSRILDKDSISLLLHLPLFLTSNLPTIGQAK